MSPTEEHETESEPSKRRVQFWQVVAMMALAYVGAYFALMARNAPAVDNTGKIAFGSSFRRAPSAGRSGLIQTYKATWLNYVFYPLDRIYYGVAPSEWSLNTLPHAEKINKETKKSR